MSDKYTRGPWLFRSKSNGVFTKPPAGTKYQFGDHIFSFHYEDEQLPSDADLALILAAPELLEALVELAEAGVEAWGAERPCVREALAAIAKATEGPAP